MCGPKALDIEYSIYNSQNQDSINNYLFQKARLLKKARCFKWAGKELERIIPSPAILTELLYEKALISLLLKDFNNSYNLLLEIPDSIRLNSKPTLYLWLTTLAQLHRWQECKSLISQLSNNGKVGTFNIKELPISSIYKSPEKASMLSACFPGLGEFYAGDIKRGITSMLINATLLGFTIQLYSTGFYITGTFAGIGLFYRFYSGGKTLSYDLALRHNESQNYLITNQYLKVISELFN